MSRSRDKRLSRPAQPDIMGLIQPQFGMRQALAVAALLLIVLAAYHNTFQCPFIFDDIYSIEDNASIREWRTALTPDLKIGETASGRPVLNLTFAINYKISSLEVWSYHAGNLLIHFLAGLALFGVVRRTLLLPVLRERYGQSAFMLGWIAAAIWLAHPLATESVTYVVQRAESLMALFYLATLYCFVRAVSFVAQTSSLHGSKIPEAPEQTGSLRYKKRWLILSVLFCALGMATKEVMVSAPVMLLLYDAAFVSGSFRETLCRRWRWYAAFALTWVLLIALMIGSGSRGDTVGFFADPEVPWWPYALTQCRAFVRYLWLSLVPWPLVFDYGLYTYKSIAQVWWQALFVIAFVCACFFLHRKRPLAGWLGLFYLAVLAPTTTVIPVTTQVIAEHRMYLPLAAVVVAVVLLGYHFLGRRVFWAGLAIVALFAVMTFERNKVYADDETLWLDVVKKYPINARANGNVGNALVRRGSIPGAIPYLKNAIALHPERGDHYNNLGHAYAKMGDFENAVIYYEQAHGRRVFREDIFYINYCQALMKLSRFDKAMDIARRLLLVNARNTAGLVIMGNVHQAQNNLTDAEECYKKALEIDENLPEAWNNWGNIKALQPGKLDDALACYKKAAALAPLSAEIQDNTARLLALLGRWQESLPYFEAELAVAPDAINARIAYGDALYALGRYADAATQYKNGLQKDPSRQSHVGGQTVTLMAKGDTESARILAQALTDAAPANPANHFLLANILLTLGRAKESLPHYQTAMQADPANIGIRNNFATALAQCERHADAAQQFEEAIKLAPSEPNLRHGYALALEKLGRIQDAITQEHEAVRLQPWFQDARQNLERLQKLPPSGTVSP